MVQIEKYNIIDNEELLNKLIIAIKTKNLLTERIRFSNLELRNKMLEGLSIPLAEYEKKYYYITKDDIYLSESELDYVLISTIGFVCYRDIYQDVKDKLFSSFEVQYEVLICLIQSAKVLLKDENIYDVDTFNNEKLTNICLAIFNNLLFYFELFGKTYIALNGMQVKRTHKLKAIYADVYKVMKKNKIINTKFNATIIVEINKFVDYISSISVDFKEEYVKYNDNSEDGTIVSITRISEIEELVSISYDFLSLFKYDKGNCHYLKDGLYDGIIKHAKNEYEKEKVKKMYGYLIE